MTSSTPTAVDFSKPMVDTVTVPGAGKLSGKTLSFHVSAELMKNQQEASPVDATGPTVVVQDSDGKPMIVAIGADGTLRLLKYDATSASGWESIDLAAGFTGYDAAKAFDVVQDDKGRLSIAFALVRTGTTSTDIFTASLVSDDGAQTDWSKLASFARKVENVDAAFVADTIKVGLSDNDEPPLVVVSGAIGNQESYYQIASAGEPAQKLEFPENVAADLKALQAISLGYAFGQKGVFFLYQQGQSQTLECTTLAGGGEGVLRYDFSPGQGAIPASVRYNCVTTPTGSQNDPLTISSDIFVGTDKGIFVINGARTSDVEQVTDQLTDVHQILVRQDRSAISIWAVSGPSMVHYIRGTKGQTIQWDSPILFSTDAVHIAPIRNRAMQANELFLIDQAANVVHYWQDPVSTMWQQRTIRAQDGDFLIDFCSYTTQIALEDEDGNALYNEPLKVTASEWTYVTANGLIYSLDRDTPAEIPTDLTGKLTIVSMAASISTPILHVQGDNFGKTLNIYPNGKVQKGLQGIDTGDDLKAATTQDGKPVFEKSYDQATWNGVADNVRQLNTASSQLQTGTRPSDAVFVSVDDPSVKHDGVLDVSHLPKDFAIGMRRQSGAWQAHPQLKEAFALGGVEHSIAGLAGDLWHDIEHAFEDGIKEAEEGVVALEDGATFVVHKITLGAEDVLAFTLTAAGKVITVVLRTLDSVLRVMSWMLKQIGAALLKILEWLGFLLIWIDIWKAHKVIAAIMTSALEYAKDWADTGLNVAQAHVDQFLETAEKDVKALTLPPAAATRGPRSDAIAAGAAHPLLSMRSPQANFINHHLMHGGLASGSGAALAGSSDPLLQFVNDVVIPTITALSNSLENDLQDLVDLVRDKGKTYADVLKLAGDLADTALDPLKALLDGLFEFLGQLIADLKGALEGSLDVPFLGALYKFVTELLGEEEDLTAINAVALMVAIPTIIVGKIETGTVPFVDEGHGLDDGDLFEKLLGSPASAPMPARGAKTWALPGSEKVATSSKAAAADAYAEGAAIYSKWPMLAGACAGIAAVVANVLIAANAATMDENSPLIAKKKRQLKVAMAIYFGLVFCKLSLTVPLKREDQNLAAYVPKAVGFGLAFCQMLTSITVVVGAPADSVAKLNGGVLAGFDVFILVAAFVGDLVDGVEQGGTAWLPLASDSLSNLSGIAQGAGQWFGGGSMEAIEALEGAEELEIPGLAYILGAGGRALGGVFSAVEVFVPNASAIRQAVNVAG